MNYIVYAIASMKRKYIYVGMTFNFKERFERHNTGRERATRSYRPFKLVYKENHKDRPTARIREKYLKSGIGKEFLKSLI